MLKLRSRWDLGLACGPTCIRLCGWFSGLEPHSTSPAATPEGSTYGISTIQEDSQKLASSARIWIAHPGCSPGSNVSRVVRVVPWEKKAKGVKE